MRENRLYGSVRGAPGDRCPYRDPGLWGAWRVTAGSTRSFSSRVEEYKAKRSGRPQRSWVSVPPELVFCWYPIFLFYPQHP